MCVSQWKKVPDEWQARQATPAVLQVSSSKHNAKKITTRERGPFHQSITAILTEEKREEKQFLNLHMLQSTCFGTYSLFTYFGSSNFSWFLLHNESLWRNRFVQLMYCTSTFWKCVWFENMGSLKKVMNVEVKNVPWSFCLFLHLEWSNGVSEKNAADFYPQLLKNRLLQPAFLLRIVTQLVEMLACLLPSSGVTDKWHLSRSFYASPLKWRENNGAKMTSRSRKKFPVRVSEAKRVKITLPCFKSLTAADLRPKDDFDQLFNFQGPVISECTRSVCVNGLFFTVELAISSSFRFRFFFSRIADALHKHHGTFQTVFRHCRLGYAYAVRHRSNTQRPHRFRLCIVPLPSPRAHGKFLPLRQRCVPHHLKARPVMPCTSAKRAACCVNVWMRTITHWLSHKQDTQSTSASRRKIKKKWQFASFSELRMLLLGGVWRKIDSAILRTIDFKSLTGMRVKTSFNFNIKTFKHRPSAPI